MWVCVCVVNMKGKQLAISFLRLKVTHDIAKCTRLLKQCYSDEKSVDLSHDQTKHGKEISVVTSSLRVDAIAAVGLSISRKLVNIHTWYPS